MLTLRDYDDCFGSFFGHPPDSRVGIDRGEKYEVETELPGFSKQDVEVAVKDGLVVITAKNEKRHVTKRLVFNQDADLDEIQAKMENGLLVLEVPKQKPKGRKIEIK